MALMALMVLMARSTMLVPYWMASQAKKATMRPLKPCLQREAGDWRRHQSYKPTFRPLDRMHILVAGTNDCVSFVKRCPRMRYFFGPRSLRCTRAQC